MCPIPLQRHSFLRRLGLFLDASKWIVLVGDWNAILDPNLDRASRGASSAARCDNALSDFLTEFELVDRFRLDHPGREMWCRRHFICEADCQVLRDDFVIYSAFGSRFGAGVSLLVGHSLDAFVNVVFAGDGGRLLVADVAIKTFE